MSNYHKKFALDFAKFGSITGIGLLLFEKIDSSGSFSFAIFLGQGFIYGCLTLFILNKYFKINRGTKILWLIVCTVSFLTAFHLILGTNLYSFGFGWN